MLEEELFSLFKGNTKLLRSAAAGVARVGRVGGGVGAVQLPSQYSPCAGNHHHHHHAPAASGTQHQVQAAGTWK